MILSSIEQRLEAATFDSRPLFRKVGTAIDPDTVVRDGIVTMDAAFVVPVSQSASSGPVSTINYTQDITHTFGVLIAVRAINDRIGRGINQRLETIITETRKALLGWQPAGDFDEIEFNSGELSNFTRSGVFWIEQYTTQHRYRSTD